MLLLLENSQIGIICAVFWPQYCSDRRDRQPVRPCTRHQDKTDSLMHLSLFCPIKSTLKPKQLMSVDKWFRSGQLRLQQWFTTNTLYDVFLLHSHYISYVTACPMMSERVASNYFVMLLKDIVYTVIRPQTVTQQTLHLWSHKDLPALGAQVQHKTLKTIKYNAVNYKRITMTTINMKLFCFNSSLKLLKMPFFLTASA